MSIFNSFKKALGFPDTYDDENDVDSDDADQTENADDTGRPQLDLTLPTRAEETGASNSAKNRVRAAGRNYGCTRKSARDR